MGENQNYKNSLPQAETVNCLLASTAPVVAAAKEIGTLSRVDESDVTEVLPFSSITGFESLETGELPLSSGVVTRDSFTESFRVGGGACRTCAAVSPLSPLVRWGPGLREGEVADLPPRDGNSSEVGTR